MTTLEKFSDLEIRLYKLTTKSHLRVGAGEGATEISAVELPLIRALILEEQGADGKTQERRVPYIPASSLHGVVRAWVEKAIRSREDAFDRTQLQTFEEFERAKEQAKADFGALLGDEPTDEELFERWHVYPSVCDPMLDADRCETITDEAKAWKNTWMAGIAGYSHNGVHGARRPCQVCAIFGYPGQRGKVRFTHAFPTTEDLPVDIITRVAINRLTGAADEGKLFDLEAIPPGVDFYFFVILENLEASIGDKTGKQLFDMGMRALNLQLAALGAHSTVGFGMVEPKKIFGAKIKPGIFDLNAPVEDIIPTIVDPDGAYQPRVNLDRHKYPDFFVALSSWRKDDEQLPDEEFKNAAGEKQIEFTAGADV